jgi:hypothetical protein
LVDSKVNHDRDQSRRLAGAVVVACVGGAPAGMRRSFDGLMALVCDSLGEVQS